MDFVRICKGARLRRTIVDRHNLIEANCEIGFDAERDRTRYEVTPGGVTIVPMGQPDYFARETGTDGPGYSD